tara:strand:- start:1307 stop:1807 length:501 start_codon:yes stop_codon:yes gene_type:complete
MAKASDLIPSRYEVIKLKTGTEIVGMTRDVGASLEVTLPMICQLSLIPGTPRTQAVFYPYSPLSADERVNIPKEQVMHRQLMNDQFIPFYDNASSKWFDMIENQSIPLANDEDKRIGEMMRNSLQRIMQRGEPFDEDDLIDEIFDEAQDISDFESALPPKDKKKIH